MEDISDREQAIELLQQLGLQEYEAKAFVALTRLPHGTAKDISEISEVPRTRVYDAVRVLESKGLVEIQHSNPQQFRAVSIDEAADTLQREYRTRTETLRDTLDTIEPTSTDVEADVPHEVWALSGTTAITSRTQQLLSEAEEEIVFVLGDESVFTESLVESLNTARKREVRVMIGTTAESVQNRVQDSLPEAEVFVSGLEWLSESAPPADDTEISRMVLIDRSTILVSTFHQTPGDEREHEQAVFGRGFDNGLVTLARRLMATGLPSVESSESTEQ
ncbi:Sugar-specific transcriptional regulator TrmB [Halovenus aranensis]|jgi:sugar-specific transcriptional regulator TrmB|uniref:Sugar-specific transcriptional regulator TrmB n=1 Tax=Halovenus aranensis TaxID=890420 RepID=A0A1G8UVE5_9EURY|nr:helix-turn-helix domain-containing protein [Halovenus aranensis]SDJ57547.1 Sugar-specific transcriptional regulator TrmB [Halovenus aranensis]